MPTPSHLFKSGNHRVLKSSEKYLVYAGDVDDRRYVYKIAHQRPEQLQQEVERLERLRAAYPSMRARLPELVFSGTVPDGLHAGKACYVQACARGDTYSHAMQRCTSTPSQMHEVTATLVRLICDAVFEQSLDPSYDARSGSFLQESIKREWQHCVAHAHVAFLESFDTIRIDDRVYPSLSTMVERVCASSLMARVDDGPSCISTLGHWNFHGDNVLFESSSSRETCTFIDPDTSIEMADPLFGLARFFYSFPHDTADYGQYVIHSSAMTGVSREPAVFHVAYLWPQIVYRRYAALNEACSSQGASAPVVMDARLADDRMQARLKLNMLLCLLRGVNANYSEAVEFVDGSGDAFRHHGLFLYLQACQFAWSMLDEEVKISFPSSIPSVVSSR